MTIGEQIVFNHFGDSAYCFRDLAKDIDAELANKDNVVKLVSAGCARCSKVAGKLAEMRGPDAN